MSASTNEIYLTCVRRKGHPKKHVDVCHQCRWRSGCKPYQKYRQPALPFEKSSERKSKAASAPPKHPKTTVKTESTPPAARIQTLDEALVLLDFINKELKEIRDLCS